MFTLGSGMYREMTKKQEYFIALIGLDGAGKTTYADSLKCLFDKAHRRRDPARMTSTVGLNLVRVDFGCMIITLWDLGGETGLRTLWTTYLDECQAAIFLIDSSCPARFNEVVEALEETLKVKRIQRIPMLILLNKSDLFEPVKATPTHHSENGDCFHSTSLIERNHTEHDGTGSTSLTRSQYYDNEQLLELARLEATIDEKCISRHEADVAMCTPLQFSISSIEGSNVQKTAHWILNVLRETP